MYFEASAPGSLMLLGEYAVLHGKNAIVGAVDKRILVKLKPRIDDEINIVSALGQHRTQRTHLEPVAPFQFVLTALQSLQQHLPSGCDLEIVSEFSAQIGFASSAAVTVATLKALHEWLEINVSLIELARLGKDIIQKVQGRGSGADIAACVMGGVISYCAEPFTIKKLPHQPDLTVLYSGTKTTTPIAIATVKHLFSNQESLFREICQAIGTCAERAETAINQADWVNFGKIMNIQQGLMDALGVNTPKLQILIEILREDPGIFGAKISGSGLGDCVIGLGSMKTDSISLENDAERIVVSLATEGVRCEKK